MASELELRHHPALLRGRAKPTRGRLPLASIQPQSAANVQRPDAVSLASVAAGDGLELRMNAETTPAGVA
jgi:hypothetical protein